MRLGEKIFLSYLVIVFISILLVGIIAVIVAPAAFTQINQTDTQIVPIRNQPGAALALREVAVTTIGDEAVTEAVLLALILAGSLSTVVAAVISWRVSQRIVEPIYDVVEASHYIADGHYDRRLPVNGDDELSELASQFNRMSAALDETEQTRRQLIADVSHELSTPLSSIKGYMEGLQDGVIPATPETFQLIHTEASRLQRLVSDLQQLSRVEAGAYSMQPRPVSPCTIVADAVSRLELQYREKNVTLQVECSSDLPLVMADEDRIGQVMNNLIGNALQYTPAHGRVWVRMTAIDSQVTFSVQDSGHGLSEDDLKRVFQRFYRVDKSRTRRSGGSGIGLTIARTFVEAHGGRIWAESEGIGKGSTFYFTMPVVETSYKLHA